MNDLLEPQLIRWKLREVLAINAAFMVLMFLYLLLRVKPMLCPELQMLFGILVHCGLLVRKLGSSSIRQSSFLYSLGYTRDQIWWQTWLASMISGCLVCGTAFLVMSFGLRTAIQDLSFENPFFPFVARYEIWMPLMWLCIYAIVLPLMHYSWIRGRQSYFGEASGWMIMLVGLGVIIWTFYKMTGPPVSPATLAGLAVAFVPVTVLLMTACRRAHGTMEVFSCS